MIVKYYRIVKETDILHIGQKVFLKLNSEYFIQAPRIQGEIIGFYDNFNGHCLNTDFDQYFLYVTFNGYKNYYRLYDVLIEDQMIVSDDKQTGIIVKAKENIFLDYPDIFFDDDSRIQIIPKNSYLYSSFTRDEFNSLTLFYPFNNLCKVGLLTSNFEICNANLTFET